jgi:hypothetical protein
MNIPGHISETREIRNNFWVKNTYSLMQNFFDLGPGWKNSDPGSIRNTFFYCCYRWFDYYTAETVSVLAAGEGDGLHDWSAPDHRLGGGGESGREYAHRHQDHSQSLPVRVPQLLAQIGRRQNEPLGS